MLTTPFQHLDRVVVIGERLIDSDMESPSHGSAWVARLRDLLVAHEPGKTVEILDRTVSEASLHSMVQRWEDDVLWFRPQWLIVHPGICDLWRAKNKVPEHMDAAAMEECLVQLIRHTRERLPACRILLVDPIILYDNADPAWYTGQILGLYPAFRAAVARAAERTGVSHAPAQEAFAERLAVEGPHCFGSDEKHPAQEGHVLIAHSVLKSLGAQFLIGDPDIPPGASIVFIGDSITDAGRRTLRLRPYGSGYMRLWLALLMARDPELARSLRIVNRGIGGQTIRNLAYRWEKDCLAHSPDHIVLKIGINDINRWLSNGENPVSLEEYAAYLEDVLIKSRDQNPAVRLHLLSPFHVSRDTFEPSYRSRVNRHLPAYIDAMREAAVRHGATFVDLHACFQRHLEHRHGSEFTGRDGVDVVHPSETGCMIIAEALYGSMRKSP